MKREGRQHGCVRTRLRMKNDDGLKFYNEIEPGGCFHTVDSSRPTNHSKFTGKCRRPRCRYCHLDPASKSRTKTKGQRKHTSSDLLSNYRVCAWRVVDDRHRSAAIGIGGHKLRGKSAADFISFFAQGDCDDDFDETLPVDQDACEKEGEKEEVMVVVDFPVQEAVQEDEIEEFSSCTESSSWTTENLPELCDAEEWCFVNADMSCS